MDESKMSEVKTDKTYIITHILYGYNGFNPIDSMDIHTIYYFLLHK